MKNPKSFPVKAFTLPAAIAVLVAGFSVTADLAWSFELESKNGSWFVPYYEGHSNVKVKKLPDGSVTFADPNDPTVIIRYEATSKGKFRYAGATKDGKPVARPRKGSAKPESTAKGIFDAVVPSGTEPSRQAAGPEAEEAAAKARASKAIEATQGVFEKAGDFLSERFGTMFSQGQPEQESDLDARSAELASDPVRKAPQAKVQKQAKKKKNAEKKAPHEVGQSGETPMVDPMPDIEVAGRVEAVDEGAAEGAADETMPEYQCGFDQHDVRSLNVENGKGETQPVLFMSSQIHSVREASDGKACGALKGVCVQRVKCVNKSDDSDFFYTSVACESEDGRSCPSFEKCMAGSMKHAKKARVASRNSQ